MLAAVTAAPRQIDIVELPDIADPPDGEALISVEAVGLCGSDLHIYDGSHPGQPYPVTQGHEFSGRIAALPSGYDGPLAVGGRVSVEPLIGCGRCYPCRNGSYNCCVRLTTIGVHRSGGLQQRVSVPVGLCYAADDLDADVAAFCEPMSVGLHAVTRADVRGDDTVVVLGAGAIGLAFAIAALDRGAQVMVVDLFDNRLQLAREIGATHAVHSDDLALAAQEWTGGEGPAVVAEATGVPAVAASAFDLVAASGRIAMIGVSAKDLTVNMRAFTAKELTVVGTRGTRVFGEAVDLVRRRREDVRQLITHRFTLPETAAAMEFALANPQDVLKVMITL